MQSNNRLTSKNEIEEVPFTYKKRQWRVVEFEKQTLNTEVTHQMSKNMFQQTQNNASKAVLQISLDTLNVTDCISIKTADHTYLFIVTDPQERRGVLTGGPLGSSSTVSVLLGAKLRRNGQVCGLFSDLYEGARAIFFIESHDGVKQFMTSEITGLVHIEANTRDLPVV